MEIIHSKRSIWDLWAKIYERLWVQSFVLRPTRELVVSFIKTTKPDARTLLDLGCGVGQFAHEIACEMPQLRVVGIDPSADMIARAKEKYYLSNISYYNLTLEEIILPS